MTKKEYVKPIMESEAFVANEYVAACWHVSCPHTKGLCRYGAWDIKGVNSVDAYIDAHSSETELAIIHKGSPDHKTWLTNENSDSYYHNTNVDGVHHELTVVSYNTYNPKHPNASF